MQHPQIVKQLLSEGRNGEALQALDSLLAETPDDAMLLTSKGLVMWRMGRRGEAISLYERAASIDPSGPGASFLDNARDIMNFFNPDLLNP